MYKKLASTAIALAFGAFAMIGNAQATGTNLKGFGQCLKTKPDYFPGTIVDAAVATPALSTLVQLVTAADLVDALSQPGNLTVFAPTNDAFGAIPEDLLGAIGSDLDVLTGVLTYHVVGGPADPRRSPIPRKVKSLQGQSLFFSYDKNPKINQSNTSCKAVRTTNGTVWIIDSVLMPQYFPAP